MDRRRQPLHRSIPNNHRIRKVGALGTITTYAGIGDRDRLETFDINDDPVPGSSRRSLNWPRQHLFGSTPAISTSAISATTAFAGWIPREPSPRSREADTTYSTTSRIQRVTAVRRSEAQLRGAHRCGARTAAGNTSTSSIPATSRIRILTPTSPHPETLQPPTGLRATTISSSRIDLEWRDNTSNERGFVVQRRPEGVTYWVQVATTPANATTYFDSRVVPLTTWHFRVRAFNDTASSAFSNEATAKTPAPPPQTGTEWTITTIAGTGEQVYGGDGGPAVRAQLNWPYGVAVDSAGNVYISDLFDHRIRRVDTRGTITTIAGTGKQGYSGDGGPAVRAQLANPQGRGGGRRRQRLHC